MPKRRVQEIALLAYREAKSNGLLSMRFLSPAARFNLGFLLLTIAGSILSLSVDGGFKLYSFVGGAATVSYLLFLRYCQEKVHLKGTLSLLDWHALWILAVWMLIYLAWGGLVLFTNPYRIEVNHGDAMFYSQTLWNLVNGLNPESSLYTLNGVFSPGDDPRYAGIDVVIHLAARVHVMRETAAEPLAAFRKVNVAGTEGLARAAAVHGVKRFVFVGSIKVNGESTTNKPFAPNDVPNPQDAYAISKWEAEQVLRRVAKETGLEVTVVRLPLVYGPGVGGNFLRLLKLIERGVPLPLALIDNRRSMIYNGNLADALIACTVHPAAAGSTYLVSDGEDVATPRLIGEIARLMGRSARLWPLPSALLHSMGRLIGKAAEVERLIGSLQVDSTRIRNELQWTPPFSADQGLAETVRWFTSQGRHPVNSA